MGVALVISWYGTCSNTLAKTLEVSMPAQACHVSAGHQLDGDRTPPFPYWPVIKELTNQKQVFGNMIVDSSSVMM